MLNKSGLIPLGRAVLVAPDEEERKDSLIEIPDFVKERNVAIDTRVVVIEVGPHCWPDEDAPRAKPGDKVLVSKMAGYVAKGPADGKVYRFINDRDIFARIKEGA